MARARVSNTIKAGFSPFRSARNRSMRSEMSSRLPSCGVSSIQMRSGSASMLFSIFQAS